MANISKVKLPNGTTYDLKVYSDHIAPIMSKTYTDVIGTANNWAGATFFFGSIKPTSWDDTWRIRYKINVYVPNHQNYRQMADVMVTGSQDAFKSYYSFNTIGQYHICYYHELYRLKQAGFTNGYGHSLGVRFYSAYNPTSTDYKRTIEIEIYELTNCTFEFYDECLLYASIPGTGSTNYNTYTELDFVTNGMQETSDANDANYQNRIYYAYAQAKETIYRYQMVFRTADGNLVPASDANNSFTIGTKNYTTTPINPFAEIYYSNSSSTYAVGNNVGNAILYRQYLMDLRYSFDVDTGSNKLVGSQPLYLTARPQADGMAVLEVAQNSIYGPIVQTLPTTDDGLIYIYLGQIYPETNSYRMELMINHPVYWYKNGAVRPYVREPLTVNGHTVNSDVPANAKFTDTVPTATKSATTGISIANHSTTSIYPVSSSTTSVYGVSTSTTTASKVTLGTAKSVPNVTSAGSASNWVFEDVTVPIRADSATSIPNVTNAGTAASWTFGDVTVPIRADADTTVPTAASSATTVPKAATSATTVPIKNANATTVPTAASSATACDDITSWAAGSGSASLTFTMDTTDTKKLKIAFSHSHTAPTLEYTARSITGVSGSTSIYGVQSTTTSVTGVSGSTTVTGVSGSTTVRGVKTGTSSTTTASHVTGGGNGTAPTLGTAISIYGVKSGTGSTTTASHVKSGGNGTAPTLGTAISIPNVTGVTDVTVPIKNADATTVPIKSSAVTVVTSATHSVTDNGHTHTI